MAKVQFIVNNSSHGFWNFVTILWVVFNSRLLFPVLSSGRRTHSRLWLTDKRFSVIHRYWCIARGDFRQLTSGHSPIGESPHDFRQYAPRTFANWRESTWLSPVHPPDIRQLARVHITFANAPLGHSPIIGESHIGEVPIPPKYRRRTIVYSSISKTQNRMFISIKH